MKKASSKVLKMYVLFTICQYIIYNIYLTLKFTEMFGCIVHLLPI